MPSTRVGALRAIEIRRRLAFAVGAIALAAVAACDDPFKPTANTAVRTDTFSVYALSGTPVNVPTAFNIVFFVTVRVESSYGFDFAFDIDAQGKGRIIPVRLAGGAVTAGRRLGLQRTTTAFEQVDRAPQRGFVYDSAYTVNTRETVIFELLAEQCQLQVSQLVYSKIELLTVDPVARVLTFRMTYDPNCGFRSFLPGVPKD